MAPKKKSSPTPSTEMESVFKTQKTPTRSSIPSQAGIATSMKKVRAAAVATSQSMIKGRAKMGDVKKTLFGGRAVKAKAKKAVSRAEVESDGEDSDVYLITQGGDSEDDPEWVEEGDEERHLDESDDAGDGEEEEEEEEEEEYATGKEDGNAEEAPQSMECEDEDEEICEDNDGASIATTADGDETASVASTQHTDVSDWGWHDLYQPVCTSPDGYLAYSDGFDNYVRTPAIALHRLLQVRY